MYVMAYSYAAITISVTTTLSSTTTTCAIDYNHPYFLNNSDNPGTPLVTQLLLNTIIISGVVQSQLLCLLS